MKENGAAKGADTMAAEDVRWMKDAVTQVQWEESSWCRELHEEWTAESGNDSDAERSVQFI